MEQTKEQKAEDDNQIKEVQMIDHEIQETRRSEVVHTNQSYIQRTQETLVQLFRFLQAKDIFISTYLDYLSERLLHGLSEGGPEREMELASLFKTECGDQFRIQSQ